MVRERQIDCEECFDGERLDVTGVEGKFLREKWE
jgi:hypothetical protein